nr:hypothetical protein [Methylobacterium sp. ZNC0032]
MLKHTAFALVWTALTALVVLWFTAIMVDCEHILARSCDTAIYGSWLDLWRLRWIFNYKELIAGILAACAAALVVVAAKIQVRATERAAARKIQLEILAEHARLESVCGSLARSLKIDSIEPEMLDDLRTQIRIADAHSLNYPLLWSLIQMALVTTSAHLKKNKGDKDSVAINARTNVSITRYRALQEIFSYLSANKIIEPILAAQQITPSGELIALRAASPVNEAALGSLSGFFSWPVIERGK